MLFPKILQDYEQRQSSAAISATLLVCIRGVADSLIKSQLFTTEEKVDPADTCLRLRAIIVWSGRRENKRELPSQTICV